jgi:lipopolysaccharide cholinephosphotransferase
MIRRRREYIKNIRRFVTVKGKNGYRTILKQLNNLVQHRIFGKGLSYWIRRCQQIESVSETGYCGTIIWPITIKDVYPAEYFEDYAELEFEKEMFTVFKRYDDILRWRYGDYMQLPDIKERQRHQFDAYIIK